MSNNDQPKTSLFGGETKPAAGGGLFGGGAPATGLFGNPSGDAKPATGLFGG